MARYPDLKVEMILNDRIVDVVEEGFDVAIRVARLPDSSLVARKLAPIRQVVCATPEYWVAHGRPRAPNDIEAHNCLIYTYLQTPGQWRFRGPDGLLTQKIAGSLHVNNGEALRSAALAGLGVYLGPTFMVGEDLRNGRMEAVLQEFEETDLAVYAVYPQNRHLSAKVRTFVDFMADRCGPEPYWDAE
jgi:DNA-binding transcriptional LysR family regulator